MDIARSGPKQVEVLLEDYGEATEFANGLGFIKAAILRRRINSGEMPITISMSVTSLAMAGAQFTALAGKENMKGTKVIAETYDVTANRINAFLQHNVYTLPATGD